MNLSRKQFVPGEELFTERGVSANCSERELCHLRSPVSFVAAGISNLSPNGDALCLQEKETKSLKKSRRIARRKPSKRDGAAVAFTAQVSARRSQRKLAAPFASANTDSGPDGADDVENSSVDDVENAPQLKSEVEDWMPPMDVSAIEDSAFEAVEVVMENDVPHECVICGQVFTGEDALREHVAEHEDDGDEFRCIVCDKTFDNVTSLQRHNKRLHHVRCRCPKCGKGFAQKYLLKEHLKVHETTKAHHCDFCGKAYKRPESLRVHKKKHLNRREYKCSVCDLEFNILDELKYHVSTKHQCSDSAPKPKDKLCPNCGRAFSRRDTLNAHYGSCMNLLQFPCEECGKRFNTRQSRDAHTHLHNPTRNFTCETCGKMFKWSSNLRDHRKIHMDEKKYKCAHCDKAFNTSSARNMHAKMHKDTKDFSCEICGRVFKWQHALRDHRQTHSDEKRFVCSVCGKGFHTSSMLSSHRKYCKAEGLECPICHVVVHGGKRVLQKHTKAHNVQFRCEVCDKTFARREGLKRHTEIHLNERNYRCGACDKTFNTGSQLSMHMTRVHRAAGHETAPQHTVQLALQMHIVQP